MQRRTDPDQSPRDQSSRLLPRLPPALKPQFEADYYAHIRPGLRLVSLLLAGLTAAHILVLVLYSAPSRTDLAVAGPMLVFWLSVLGLTWVRGFGRVWRPILVLLGWVAATLVLEGLGHALSGQALARGRGAHPPPPAPQLKFFFVLQLAILMVTLSTLRLPSRWTALLQGGVLAIGLGSFGTNLPLDLARDLHFILLPALILLLALLLAAYSQEQFAQVAFYASHLLEEERDDERREREQTQRQLHVLAQAIGGIVHDLGNPLTAVQMGSDLIGLQADEGDAKAIRETNEAIQDGAQMLNALRLSLMEQTRVLEGKPIPVDLRTEPLRPIIEAGAHFQNPRYVHGHTISLIGDDLELCADRMRLVTVFMNLIGNALKYSDGEVHIVWRNEGGMALVGVLDQGESGRGISKTQAQQLFVAFGRLDAHIAVEGTGLGLVSVRKIVEAHGGEVFVEGHEDGTAASLPFTTGHAGYPSLLEPGFLSAFVIACRVQCHQGATRGDSKVPAEAFDGL